MLGDDLSDELVSLQQQAESTFRTLCRIRRPGPVTTDPVTGADVYSDGVTMYAGRCKVQSREGQVRTAESADSTVTVQAYEVHVPVSSGPYRVGDLVEIVEAQGGPVIRRLRIVGLHTKTFQTAQRLPVEEVP